jgi:hypothetical protein
MAGANRVAHMRFAQQSGYRKSATVIDRRYKRKVFYLLFRRYFLKLYLDEKHDRLRPRPG